MFKSQDFHHDIPSIRKFAGSVPEDEFETVELSFFEVLGRKDDSFLRPDGSEIPSASLLNALDEVFTDAASGLAEYRLTERRPGTLEFHFVPQKTAEAVSSEHLNRCRGQLEMLYGEPIDLALSSVDALPQLSGYKRRKVVSDRLGGAITVLPGY